MGLKIGFEGKLYVMEGGYGSGGSWVEVEIVKDVTLNQKPDEAEVTTRQGGGHKQFVAGLFDSGVEFEITDDPDDVAYQLLQNAFVSRSKIGVACLDGDITLASSGLKADMAVLDFTRNEALGQAMTRKVTLKPTYSADKPVWLDAGATGTGTETDGATV